MVTATESRSEGYGGLPTIFDRLEERGVSWKFYVQDYDPRLTIEAEGRADRSTQAVRVPLLNFPRYVRDRRLFSHVVDLEEYYEDLERGTLPEVAYIAPAGGSEHPPGGTQPGQTLVQELCVTALARSEAWRSSAFMWTYDEWGGWFDHVRPPPGRGFRVPALLVSPYARRGVVDSTPLDHTSILRFIEDNWRLAPLAARDARGEEPRRRVRLLAPTARAEAHRRRARSRVPRQSAPLADLPALRRRGDAGGRSDRAGRLERSRAGPTRRIGRHLRRSARLSPPAQRSVSCRP